jgi:hypothetical protein
MRVQASQPPTTSWLDRVLPEQPGTFAGTTRFPHAELGFFLGGVTPIGLAYRLPEGKLRTATAVVIGALSVPTTGALGALLGAGYDLGHGVVRAVSTPHQEP